jgi:hypothetical protein
VFTKRLREGVRRGEITCSVRFWMHPHVRVGARYAMGEGAIEIDSIEMIGFPDITPELGTRVGISGRAGSAESGQARPKREDLSGAVPLRAAAGEASREVSMCDRMRGNAP